MDKGCMIGIGIVVLLVIGLAALGLNLWGSFQGLSHEVKEFASYLQKGDYKKAYKMTTADFQKKTDFEKFRHLAQAWKLKDHQGITWNSFNIKNDRAEVRGKAKLKGGETSDVRLVLKDTGDQWKIQGIYAEIGKEKELVDEGLKIPTDKELKSMIRATLLTADRSLKAGDFKQFRERQSVEFKKKYTAPDLKKAFKEAIEKKVDLAVVQKLNPILEEEKRLNIEERRLGISGKFESTPYRILFDLHYIQKEREWKLYDINLKFQEVQEKKGDQSSNDSPSEK